MVDEGIRDLDQDLRGLDALEIPRVERPSRVSRFVAGLWPKLFALAIVLGGWQLVVWLELKPTYLIPPASAVFAELASLAGTAAFWQAIAITMQRAAIGFALALVVGSAIGLAVSQSSVLRRGIGSLITGLQTMPSIVWFPFAILLFQLSEAAILFVIVLGAAPAIANGVVSGVDHIPPLITRAGTLLGARGPAAWRHVVLPAALPGYVAGLKQGWAFAWRSLMAGELLVIIAARPSIGVRLQFARELSNAEALLAMMIVVLIIGILVDSLFFGVLERRIRANRGLLTD